MDTMPCLLKSMVLCLVELKFCQVPEKSSTITRSWAADKGWSWPNKKVASWSLQEDRAHRISKNNWNKLSLIGIKTKVVPGSVIKMALACLRKRKWISSRNTLTKSSRRLVKSLLWDRSPTPKFHRYKIITNSTLSGKGIKKYFKSSNWARINSRWSNSKCRSRGWSPASARTTWSRTETTCNLTCSKNLTRSQMTAAKSSTWEVQKTKLVLILALARMLFPIWLIYWKNHFLLQNQRWKSRRMNNSNWTSPCSTLWQIKVRERVN